MLIKEAVVLRFKNICMERDINYNKLATNAGMTPSTVYSMMEEERKDLSIITIKKLCDGLELCISDFFDDDIFRELEQEIQ